MRSLFYHQTRVEKEIWRRIRLSVWAYAYEFKDDPVVPDAQFDAMAKEIDPGIETGRTELDEFWKNEFHPHTGMWIRKHPQLQKIERIYERFYT